MAARVVPWQLCDYLGCTEAPTDAADAKRKVDDVAAISSSRAETPGGLSCWRELRTPHATLDKMASNAPSTPSASFGPLMSVVDARGPGRAAPQIALRDR